jgi:hypothetical protein
MLSAVKIITLTVLKSGVSFSWRTQVQSMYVEGLFCLFVLHSAMILIYA